MKKDMFVSIGLLVCLLCTVATGVAGVPQMINFQGRLTDEEDNALNGTYSVRFRIYADSLGATTHLWEESWLTTEDNPLQVFDGIFNVLLGSLNPIPDTVFTGADRWLEMKVENEKMSPLKPIASVGYAFHSATSDTAEYAHVATSDGDWVIDGDNIYRLAGNVGIGTTSPTKKLTVEGSICITGSNYLMFYRPGEAASYMYLDGSGYLRYRPETLNDVLSIGPSAPSNTVFLANTGNVGIGTASPSEKLDVDGNAKVNGQLDVNSHKIVNVVDPTSDQDAATKKYVDDNVGSSPILTTASGIAGPLGTTPQVVVIGFRPKVIICLGQHSGAPNNAGAIGVWTEDLQSSIGAWSQNQNIASCNQMGLRYNSNTKVLRSEPCDNYADVTISNPTDSSFTIVGSSDERTWTVTWIAIGQN